MAETEGRGQARCDWADGSIVLRDLASWMARQDKKFKENFRREGKEVELDASCGISGNTSGMPYSAL